ncbi:hypothetical protein BCR32DRAFT_248194 [Anaeromyces robustus]|uniref:Uncharacterized protein n=1 Tax=Anaeromyces robustus TaxID=1754192 RepID=A0A1Y1WVI3_9FUNG|nr:hypothetical protein BCR32DRAFT_248194 [Anaeromyces robustus]|eukprot:ORX77134.1 hypothetical protein BCR32DRAFT_248194 [Anaeromyces robustus]
MVKVGLNPFIELPDIKDYIHRYILVPYEDTFENFIYEYNTDETIYVSINYGSGYQQCKCIVDEYFTKNTENSFNNCDYNRCSKIQYIPSEFDLAEIDFQYVCFMIGFVIILF